MKLTHPDEVATEAGRLMEGFERPWAVAGGWALDLFFSRVTREHADVELTILRRDQGKLRSHLDGWTCTISVPDDQGGHRREDWAPGEHLELPVHEIHARSPDEAPTSIEFLLSEAEADQWVYRRDRSIVLPLALAFVDTAFGVRALSPEIALLFKSKSPRPKDDADFHEFVEVLGASRTAWLRGAVARTDPSHPWLQVLDRQMLQ